MLRIETFRDLEVYQLGLREAKRVFVITILQGSSR